MAVPSLRRSVIRGWITGRRVRKVSYSFNGGGRHRVMGMISGRHTIRASVVRLRQTCFLRMRLRSRSITPADIRDGFALMACRVPWTGDAASVMNAWTALVVRKAIASRLVENLDGPEGAQLVSFGLNAFVRLEWLQRYTADPFPHPGRHVLESCAQGRVDEYLLSDGEVAAANSGQGLHSLTLGVGFDPALALGSESTAGRYAAIRSFGESLEGFNLASIWSECFEGVECDVFLGSGAWQVRDDYARFYTRSGRSRPAPAPVLVGRTADEARDLARTATLTSPLFVRHRPRYCFTPEQQDLLLRALDDVNDVQLVRALGIGPHALRRRWQRIFRRVEALQPADDPILPKGAHVAGKRARLLLRVRGEMHELRPHSFRTRLEPSEKLTRHGTRARQPT